MPKVKRERIYTKSFDLCYDIYVRKSGIFYTTLPELVVDKLLDMNIPLQMDSTRNKGYFQANTLDDLKAKVNDTIKICESRKLANKKIVLKYRIDTACSYAVTDDGEIVPNCSSEYIGKNHKEDYEKQFREGTVECNSTYPKFWGLNVYVRPFIKEEYEYIENGEKKIKAKYERWNLFNEVPGFDEKKAVYLKWLSDVIGMISSHDNFHLYKGVEELDEIDYTEERAKFFVDLIKWICILNEKIKGFLSPDQLVKLIDNRVKSLSFLNEG